MNPAEKLREIINWLAVFKKEYDIPEEASSMLKEKLEELGDLL